METKSEKIRCPWGSQEEFIIQYHDKEWGLPVHNDTRLFEFLMLDCFQAGLSWSLILRRRENFRRAFAGFDLQTLAGWGDHQIEQLMLDSSIIRNRRKINAAIINARVTLQVQNEFGSLDQYLWSFTGGLTIHNHWENITDIPAVTPEAEAMSRDLRKRGFQFTGPTVCYAVMQSIGMVNDHVVSCFRYEELLGKM